MPTNDRYSAARLEREDQWRRRMLTRNVRFFCPHCHLLNACTMSLGMFSDNVQIRCNWDCLSTILAHVATNQQTDPNYVRIHTVSKKIRLTVLHSCALVLSSLLELESGLQTTAELVDTTISLPKMRSLRDNLPLNVLSQGLLDLSRISDRKILPVAFDPTRSFPK